MIIATAGHVDHGKTTLIKALTGADTDRLPEERRRGMSIDLGFAYVDMDGASVGFIDVPGHERFIRNMLAGVAGIDFALLVIAADDGVMAQTVEHLGILDLLGIRQGAVALTKIDRVDSARIAGVTREITALLHGSTLAGAPVFPVSANIGDGIDALRGHLAGVATHFSPREPEGNFRLAIDRCFSLRGFGLTVTGAVFSGTVETGDALLLSPSGIRVRVRGIYANDQPTDQGAAGQRCAINIAAAGGDTLNSEAIHRGHWLLAEEVHAPAKRIDARIRLLASEPASLKHWLPVHVHIGAEHVLGRVALLEGAPLAPGNNGLVQLVLDKPVGAVRGDRIILRDAAARRTIGGGRVIDPFAPGKGRTRPERVAIVRAFETPLAQDALHETLALSPGGVDLESFKRAFNLTPAEADALWRRVPMRLTGRGIELTGVSEAHFSALCTRIPDVLAEWRLQHPQSLGPNEPELHHMIRPSVRPQSLRAALKVLLSRGDITRSGTLLHLPGHTVKPSVEDDHAWQRLSPIFDAAGLTQPRIRELAEETGKEPQFIEALLSRLARTGHVARVSGNRFFTPRALRELAIIAANAATAGEGAFTAAEFRTGSGIGRNLTIEVLEYFDHAGLTRRIGAKRVMRADIEDIFGA